MARQTLKDNEYVADSTKGNAVLDPRTFKGDSLVQVWLDRRLLATLSNWLEDGGIRTKFMSDIVKFSLDMITAQLVDGGVVEMVNDTVVATDILEYRYRVNLNPRNRGKKNLLHNMVLTERIRDDSIGTSISKNSLKADYDKAIEEHRKEIERMKKSELSKIKVDKNGLVINDTIDRGNAKPKNVDDWIAKSLKSKKTKDDNCTVRPFTEDDVREWEAREKAKLEAQNSELARFNPKEGAIY